MLRNHDRMRLQRFERHLDGSFELWIVAGRDGRGIIFHFDVRGNAMIFNFPLAVQAEVATRGAVMKPPSSGG